MYVTFDESGVLHVKPENYSDVATLKWFINEFAAHGTKMIEIETELDPSDKGRSYRTYPQYEDAYGYANKRRQEKGYYKDRPPFSPQMFYDNYPSDNIYEIRQNDDEGDDPYRVGSERRGGDRGGRGNRR